MKITDDEILHELGRFNARVRLDRLCAQFGVERGRTGRYSRTAYATRRAVAGALQRLQRAGRVTHVGGAGAGWRLADPPRTSDPRHGLFSKYEVRRLDGSSGKGGKHERCAYFVLDLEHDEHAIPALQAYAESAQAARPELARDLLKIVAAHGSYPACGCREVGCPHSLARAFHEGPAETAGRLMNRRSPGTSGA